MSKALNRNFSLMFLAGIAILFNLYNQIQIAQYFGTSAQRDTYFLAKAFIVFLFAIHFRSLSLFFLPKHVNYLNNDGKEGIGHVFAWIYFIGVSVLSFTLILAFYTLISFDILPFQNNTLLFQIIQILLIGFIFQSTNSLLVVVYHSRKHFFFPALQSSLTVAFSIIIIFLYYQEGVISIAWGYLFGNIFFFIFLFLGKYQTLTTQLNFKYNLQISKVFIKETLPFILIAFFTMLVHIIEPFFVSKQSSGVISYLGYSYQIILILLSLVSSSIITTFFPQIADLYSKKKFEELEKVVLKTIQIVFTFCLSISAFVFLFGQEIISIVFERGNFNSNDSLAIYKVLRWELLVFVFGSLNLLLNRFFYLDKNTKALFKASMIGLLIYIFSGLFFYSYLSYQGLGIALAVWSMTYFFILLFQVRGKVTIDIKYLFLFFFKISVVIIIVALTFLSLSSFFEMTLSFVNLTIIGLVYSLLLFLIFFKYLKS